MPTDTPAPRTTPQPRTYTLTGADGRPFASTTPGDLGGHRRGRLYGRLDCPAALRAIAAGGYIRHRVFFADEATAIAAGYRPCAVCLPDKYQQWKAHPTGDTASDTPRDPAGDQPETQRKTSQETSQETSQP
ncbi:Ada metal-binding domain-containing protein [Streptomyces sp. NPDC004610]|uniref:Ada metal-binding domain-containing protein n=1 Tax=unclassified Streptomyces TaxID=2593676 RepID=UPI0033B975AE